MCGCLPRVPHWGLSLQPRRVPPLGTKPVTPLVHRLAPNALTHTSQDGSLVFLLLSFKSTLYEYIFKILFLFTLNERGEEGERERVRNIDVEEKY